ncbi:MAG TPA: L,D-transpeptidase [Aggregatilineaceae bacterium]|nr:L,D-transpeptidase [Aggregatilineaceae bacterium]
MKKHLLLIAIIMSTFVISRPAGAAPVLWQGHPSCAGISLDQLSTPDCDALMASRPTPNVTRVPIDFGVVSGVSLIRFNQSTVPLYDKPGGTQVDTMNAGYTYVNVLQVQDDWAEIRPGQWVSLSIARWAQPSSFSGVFINGLDMPFAWVLWPHCATDSPAGMRQCEGSGQLQRYQLVNIYATINVRGWNWHLIGPGLWTNQQNLSIVYPTAPISVTGHWAAVNTFEQNVVAYDGGTPRMATLVSSGLDEERWKTNNGTFSVRLKVENGPMSGQEGTEDFYALDQVPYAIYFNGLESLHGTYWHDSFGYRHSHGCVNLTISDAKWLYENWLVEGSTVHVYGD